GACRGRGRGGRHRALPLAGESRHRPASRFHPRARRPRGLDSRPVPAGRPTPGAPDDPQAGRARRRQERDGRRAGQAGALAAHLHRGRAALVPRPPPALWRLAVWGASRHRPRRPGTLWRSVQRRQRRRLLLAADTMSELNAINDVDLGEVERSRSLMDDAEQSLSGLHRVFDLWQALRWIAPLDAPRSRRTARHAAATELLSGRYGLTLMELLHGDGRVHGDDPEVDAAVNALLDECRALAARERFLHWELAFPGVWRNPMAGGEGGFDAVIGNPPWDRMKLQEIEWFAERRPEIALQARASDRKRLIAALKRDNDPLAVEYDHAAKTAEDAARVARSCG